MSTPSEPVAAPASGVGPDRRLHPLSWLFVLLQQLRSFAIPIVVLLVTGRGGPSILLPIAGVAGLVLVSVVQYFSYRYRADVDGFVVTSGVLQRTRRDIPYERIHTVNLHQSLLHRIFSVVEVRLESAGGKEAEAVMRVLSMTEARALEHLVRERGAARRHDTGAIPAATPEAAETPLLALDTMEVIRLGLISNRGMVVVAAAVGALWQFADELQLSSGNLPADAVAWAEQARGYVAAHLHNVAALAFVAALVIVPALIVVRVLSVLLALLQYHGFRVTEAGRQLQIERGLLSRVRHQLPRRRIQAWRINETLLHRWFGRQTLRVDSATGGGDDQHGVRYLAPVATPAQVDALIARVRRDATWPPTAWEPVAPRAWRRWFMGPSIVLAAGIVPLTWAYGSIALWPLLLVPVLLVRARAMGRFAGYALSDRTLAIRQGWLNRSWGLVEIRKLQALRLSASPLDRRHDMATLWLDTAGASAADGVLRIRYLAAAEARRLFADLAQRMSAAPPMFLEAEGPIEASRISPDVGMQTEANL